MYMHIYIYIHIYIYMYIYAYVYLYANRGMAAFAVRMSCAFAALLLAAATTEVRSPIDAHLTEAPPEVPKLTAGYSAYVRQVCVEFVHVTLTV